MGTATEKLISD